MFFFGIILYPISLICIVIVLRVLLHKTALILVLKKWLNWFEDRVHVHQFFKVTQFNHNSQPNHFYSKVSTYLNSLDSIQDSDFTNLFAAHKPNDIVLSLDDNQTVHDVFLGARITWENQARLDDHRRITRTFVLKIKRKDKRRILKPYFQHIHTVSDEIEKSQKRDRKLYLNSRTVDCAGNGWWRSVPWTHPSTMDTIAMDSDLKNKVKSDLELFLKSKQYYHRLGRAWRRSYLLYGPSGTGKSSFISAVANFLSYDVYSLDLFGVTDDSDLTMLLLQTTNRSVIVIEGLDRFLKDKPTTSAVTLSGIMNFMDGIASSCGGEERIFMFTANTKETIDPGLLRPGRIDVHIHFPMCDFNSFKTLANSYLGLKDHKLFPQVEGVFSSAGAEISAAEVGEIMIAHRGSPSRALKTVITALQTNAEVAAAAKGRMAAVEDNGVDSSRFKDGIPPMKELRKLYGLLRMKSTNKIGPLDHDSTTEFSR